MVRLIYIQLTSSFWHDLTLRKHNLHLAVLEKYVHRNRFPDSNGVIGRRRGIRISPFLALGHNAPCRAWGRYGSGSDYRQHSDSDSGGGLLQQLGDCFAIGWEFQAGVPEISSRLGSSEQMNLRKLHFGSYLLKGLRFPFLQYWSLALSFSWESPFW